MTWLLFYLLAVTLYDLRARRIPNWCTLPIIIAGVLAHFPGHMDLWLACFLLFSAWAGGWMGAGDVKLWMAVLWALPDSKMESLILLLLLSFLFTGALQFIWRVIHRQSLTGTQSPAAWRVIPFLLMVWHVH